MLVNILLFQHYSCLIHNLLFSKLCQHNRLRPIKDCDQIEKVQRAAACWVTSDYSWLSSVTAILSNLNWPTLASHLKISKLQTFYKAIYHLTVLPIPDYFLHVTSLTRNYHSLHYVIPYANSDSYIQV